MNIEMVQSIIKQQDVQLQGSKEMFTETQHGFN